MSNFSRPMPSHLRGQSIGASQQSTFLQQKIADKKTELANLKDLQALSGGLADQMQMLADKLQTLSDGTEGTLVDLCSTSNLQYQTHEPVHAHVLTTHF
jgi:DASH complex subunit DAD2